MCKNPVKSLLLKIPESKFHQTIFSIFPYHVFLRLLLVVLKYDEALIKLVFASLKYHRRNIISVEIVVNIGALCLPKKELKKKKKKR